MAKETNIELKRVNINLPTDLVERVRVYAEGLGINNTAAYIVLLNQALNQDNQLKTMPVLAEIYKQLMSNPKLMELAQNQIDSD